MKRFKRFLCRWFHLKQPAGLHYGQPRFRCRVCHRWWFAQ